MRVDNPLRFYLMPVLPSCPSKKPTHVNNSVMLGSHRLSCLQPDVNLFVVDG